MLNRLLVYNKENRIFRIFIKKFNIKKQNKPIFLTSSFFYSK